MTEALRDAGHVDVLLWDAELWETVLSARPLDDDGVERAALAAVTDVLSCSLAARHDPRLTMLLASASSDAGGVAVPGHTVRLSRPDAALIGGYQAHALDWDDVHSQVRGHPSAVLFPALWALADESTAGADFLEALIVGVEVMARLGRLAGVSHHRRGWHPTATLGPVAAAIAGARLAGLSAAATRAAAGLAASQSGGTRAQFGSPAKPLHAGLAAAAAVRSVLWAQAGITAGADPLFGPDGLACALDFESRDPSVLAAHWGERWAINDPGLIFKRFPFCSAATSAYEAAEALASAWAQDGSGLLDNSGLLGNSSKPRDAVVAVRVSMRPGSDAALRFHIPEVPTEGRFSLEYIVGLALSGKPAINDHFVRLDEDARALARRTVRVPEGSPSREPWARVDVTFADGHTRSAEIAAPRGSAGRPLTSQDCRDKLEAAVNNAESLLTTIAALPHQTVGDLARAITRAVNEGDTSDD